MYCIICIFFKSQCDTNPPTIFVRTCFNQTLDHCSHQCACCALCCSPPVNWKGCAKIPFDATVVEIGVEPFESVDSDISRDFTCQRCMTGNLGHPILIFVNGHDFWLSINFTIDVLLPYALHVCLVSGHSCRNPKCNRNTPQRCPNVIPEPHAVQVKALASDVSPKCKAGICANSIATIATIIFFIFGSNISISSTCWILVEWGLSNFQRPRIWCCRSQSDGVFRCVSIHTPPLRPPAAPPI